MQIMYINISKFYIQMLKAGYLTVLYLINMVCSNLYLFVNWYSNFIVYGLNKATEKKSSVGKKFWKNLLSLNYGKDIKKFCETITVKDKTHL